MHLFELPLRFKLNVTVKVLIKFLKLLTHLKYVHVILVQEIGFSLFKFKVSKKCKEHFQTLKADNDKISYTA